MTDDLITVDEGAKVLEQVEADYRENRRLSLDAEHYILNFDAELSRYRSEKAEYMQKAVDSNAGIRGGVPGRPTESAAIKSVLFDNASPQLRWLKAVEILRKTLGERKNIFLRVRVEAARKRRNLSAKGRPGWVGYVQRRYAEELERRFLSGEVYSVRTIHSYWQSIIDKAVLIYKKIS